MLTKKIALAAGALTLAAGGVAAAAGSPPEAAEPGLTTAEANVGVDLPASQDSHPGAPETETEAEAEAPETEALEESPALDDTEGEGPVDDHGAEVSVVAQSDEHEGRAHGEAVSAVARDNHGAERRAEAKAGGDIEDDGAEDDDIEDDDK